MREDTPTTSPVAINDGNRAAASMVLVAHLTAFLRGDHYG